MTSLEKPVPEALRKNLIDFTKKSVALVTGASRGIGREIAIQLSNEMAQDSVVILIARSEAGLKESTQLMNKERVKIRHFVIDLSDPLPSVFAEMLSGCKELYGEAETAILFNNAGSLGTIDSLSTIKQVDVWQTFCNLNITSVGILNPIFIQAMTGKKIFLVNISSLIGRRPFRSLGMYGLAKAARDYYFKVLAMEEPAISVLNYSPGPVDTDMFKMVAEQNQDETLQQNFNELVQTKTVLLPKQTVGKMMKLLKEGFYNSGDTIDYYDL